jgi:hypothetical protein
MALRRVPFAAWVLLALALFASAGVVAAGAAGGSMWVSAFGLLVPLPALWSVVRYARSPSNRVARR